jgi:predicted nucleic acid-binding Zn ribbon protein
MAGRRGGEPQILGEILASIMRRRAYAKPLELTAIREAWARAAGERLGSRSRVAQFRDGILTIEVASSAQRYELEAFQAPVLLGRLQADASIQTVRRLVFRVGHFTP